MGIKRLVPTHAARNNVSFHVVDTWMYVAGFVSDVLFRFKIE